jgi:hypothetical protein
VRIQKQKRNHEWEKLIESGSVRTIGHPPEVSGTLIEIMGVDNRGNDSYFRVHMTINELRHVAKHAFKREDRLEAALRLARGYLRDDPLENAVVCAQGKPGASPVIMSEYTIGTFLDDVLYNTGSQLMLKTFDAMGLDVSQELDNEQKPK